MRYFEKIEKTIYRNPTEYITQISRRRNMASTKESTACEKHSDVTPPSLNLFDEPNKVSDILGFVSKTKIESDISVEIKNWVLLHMLESMPSSPSGMIAFNTLWKVNPPLILSLIHVLTDDSLSDELDDKDKYRENLNKWLDVVSYALRPKDHSNFGLTEDKLSIKNLNTIVDCMTSLPTEDAKTLKSNIRSKFITKLQQIKTKLEEASVKSVSTQQEIKETIQQLSERLGCIENSMLKHEKKQMDNNTKINQFKNDIKRLMAEVKEKESSIQLMHQENNKMAEKVTNLETKRDNITSKVTQSRLDKQTKWIDDLKYLTEQLYINKALYKCDEKCQQFYENNVDTEMYGDIKTPELWSAWYNFVEEFDFIVFKNWLEHFSGAKKRTKVRASNNINVVDSQKETVNEDDNHDNMHDNPRANKKQRLDASTVTHQCDKSAIGPHNMVFHSRNAS